MKKIIKSIILGFIGFFVVLIATRMFVVDLYYVPTASMAFTLPAKSYIVVNKTPYGAKLPESTYQIPMLSKVLKKLPKMNLFHNTRFWGYAAIKRNDIVLFRPKKQHIIKRVIGISGDTIAIQNARVFINNQPEKIASGYRFEFYTKENIALPTDKGRADILNKEGDQFHILVDGKAYNLIDSKTLQAVDTFKGQKPYGASIYPPKLDLGWNINYFGPIVVPYKGYTIELNPYTAKLYEKTIQKYEEKEVVINDDNDVLIAGTKAKTYTFTKDYYFLMGDNRMQSFDSRYMGFIPKDKILGRVDHWF